MKPGETKIMQIFRNRIRTRKNPEYEQWWNLYRRRQGGDWEMHHLLKSVKGRTGKLNSFLIVNMDEQQHKIVTVMKELDDEEFIIFVAEALNDNYDYIEHLQEKIKHLTK